MFGVSCRGQCVVYSGYYNAWVSSVIFRNTIWGELDHNSRWVVWWASLGLVGVIGWVVVGWVGVFLVILDWLGPDGLLGELWAKGGPVVCCALGACMDP